MEEETPWNCHGYSDRIFIYLFAYKTINFFLKVLQLPQSREIKNHLFQATIDENKT